MSGRSWGCEEADDRRVEEIAGQLEETEQADLYSSVSADLGNNREHDDRRIEANVGGPLPSNIREYLDELTRSLALTPPIHPRVLKTLYDRKDYPAMLGWIKNSMSLKLRVGLRIVDRPETSPPMWIEMPDPIPAFGTAEFNETKVIVNARRDILETKPFPAVVAGFAHELSHVVLFSIGHRLQDDEKAVDLTAMILGYQYDICDAEFTETNGELSEKWRLGYLTSAEALAASRHIAKIRYGWKSKFKTAHRPSETGHRPSKDWQTERGIIAFFTVGAVILSVVVLPIFFQGKSTDAARPQGAADSSVQANPNKLNPAADDIVAVQNRLIELRYLKGPADGVWGPKSRMALLRVQDRKWSRGRRQMGQSRKWSAVFDQSSAFTSALGDDLTAAIAPAAWRCSPQSAAPRSGADSMICEQKWLREKGGVMAVMLNGQRSSL